MEVNNFYCFKIDQLQTFDPKGKRLVVTKLQANPLVIKQIKLKDKDGYWAYQVIINRIKGKGKIREIRINQQPSLKNGEKIKINDVFKCGDSVQVSGLTKGKGFAGGMKRWGFKGGPRTHGQSDRARAIGSIGQRTDPGRVWKGKKMPGRMGGKTKTTKGLKVFKIDEEKNEIWLTGLVPGGRKGLIKLTKNANN